jgi:effector-binding domain-containing protein
VVNLEVGVEIDSPFSGAGDVLASVLPVGTVASTVHFGPYQKLVEAHAAVKVWCAKNGYELSGVSWEIYGHWVEEWNKDASKIRTDVFWLVK